MGLTGDDERDLAFGIITATDAATGTLTLLAAAPRERVCMLRWGTLGLDETFREIRLGPPPESGGARRNPDRGS